MNALASLDRITHEETIFNAAVELRDPAKRIVYLDLACDGDPALRARLEKMLAADTKSFFEKPLAQPSPTDAATLAVPPMDEPEPAALGETIGRYRLLEKIGEGGMGVVYMAEQEEPVRRRVALKIIKLGMDTRQVIARFEAERQALALMDHPNIAKVLDAGATDMGRPYFVMELVRGVRITEYCDQNRLGLTDRLKLFTTVCQAIQSAHQKGIIHRDIKPSNVLVTLNGGVPHPMVIDFGVAKATNQKLTEKTLFTNFATMIGTPAYMSPEQAEMSKLDVDTRSDIYSLGVLLYELLAGTTPFPEERLRSVAYGEMQRIIAEEEPERPSTRLTQQLVGDDVRSLNSNSRTKTAEENRDSSRRLLQIKDLIHQLRGDLDWIVMKCLEKDRSRRYETANGLAADIQRHLKNEPVNARPPSRIYQIQKMARRNRVAFAATAAVLISLLFGIMGSTWQAIRATRAEREQRQLRERAEGSEKREASLRQQAELHERAARASAFFAQGTSKARIGQWRGAATDFTRAIELDTTNHEFHHWLTPLLIQAEDVTAYQMHCEKMVALFGATLDPLVAERMAKSCLILPASFANSKVVKHWVEVAVDGTQDNKHAGWFQLVKGLAEYRLGRFESAVEWLRLSLLQSDPHRDAQTQIVMAMAQHQLGQRELARATLEKAKELQSQLPGVENGGPGVMWLDWLFNRVLLREAQALVEVSPSRNIDGVEIQTPRPQNPHAPL